MSDDDKKKGTFPRVGRTKLRCWACGKKGHKRSDFFFARRKTALKKEGVFTRRESAKIKEIGGAIAT